MNEYEIGDRFEDTDPRSEGRVVELRGIAFDGRWIAQVEVHPKNPTAVGRHTTLSSETLTRYFRKISH